MTPLPLRTRLTAWYSCSLAIILAIFAFTVTWQQGRIGLRRVDRQLADLTLTVDGLLRDELSETSDPAAAAREVVQTVTAPGRDIMIVDEGGHVLAANRTDLALRSPVVDASLRHDPHDVFAGSSADGRTRIGARRSTIGGAAYDLVVGVPLDDAERERREAREAMWLGIPVLVLLSVAGGFWLSSRALAPITDMARRATMLPVDGTDNLGTSERDDELGQLGQAFNGLLARLRASLITQRRFMADASHELRTPISVIRSTADVILDQPRRSEDEYRDALGLVRAQAAQAGRLMDDMLMLARADAGGFPVRAEQLYLDELVETCATSIGKFASERRVSVSVSTPGDLLISGDEDLLRRMLLNLMMNAVQHAHHEVTVTVTSTPEKLSIAIGDDGAGVPPEDRDRIFDRFVQLDPARRRAGAGLGLPISRWIAEAHSGDLSLEASSSSGSVFVVHLPPPLATTPSAWETQAS